MPPPAPPIPSGASVTNWLNALHQGNRDGVRRLWDRYFHRMTGVARARLGPRAHAACDDEDIAISAFDSFCRGMEQGHFPNLEDRDELWRLLAVITVRKAINAKHHESRAKRGGHIAHLADDDVLGELLSREPAPELVAAMNDQCAVLFDRLKDDTLRLLVMLKLEGRTDGECASRLGRTRVTVQRMLRLIRQTWQQEADS